MPWPNVNDGDDINAVLWNDAVRDQVVTRFATTSARDSGIATPLPGMASAVTPNTAAEGLYLRTSAGTWRAPWNMSWGLVGVLTDIDSVVTGLGGTRADSNLSVTWTAVANRYYRATGLVRIVGTVAGDLIDGHLTDAANTVITGAFRVPVGVTFGEVITSWVSAPFTRAAGSTTVKLRTQRINGTGTYDIDGGNVYQCYLAIEDVGPSGAPA